VIVTNTAGAVMSYIPVNGLVGKGNGTMAISDCTLQLSDYGGTATVMKDG